MEYEPYTSNTYPRLRRFALFCRRWIAQVRVFGLARGRGRLDVDLEAVSFSAVL